MHLYYDVGAFTVQAELAKIQGAEQSLHLQVTSLTHELKQKDSRLEGLSKDKQQAEEQLSKLTAELGTVKAQLEGMAGAVQIEGTASHVSLFTTYQLHKVHGVLECQLIKCMLPKSVSFCAVETCTNISRRMHAAYLTCCYLLITYCIYAV
jgi:predicted nuclease with TOPRIM domain